ncbi:MAG: putative ABC exporter domain-containing protein, partial [Planctomycetota bacterium]
QLKTPGGAILALLLLATMLVGVGPALIAGFISPMSASPLSEFFVRISPVMLLAVVTLSVLSESGRTLLELRPPELQFVLAGPFTDSQVLTYRLASTLVSVIPIAIVVPLVLGAYVESLPSAFVGFGLATLFVFLVTFLYSLAKPRLPRGVAPAIRMCLLIATIAVPIEILARTDFSQAIEFAVLIETLSNSWSLHVVGALFRPFTNLMFGPLGAMSLFWSAISVGLVLIALLGCYRFNSGFAEMAVEGIARRAKRMERMRAGNFSVTASQRGPMRRSIPGFSWLHGFGPVAWLQLTILYRRNGRLLMGMVGLGIAASIGIGLFLAFSTNPLDPSIRMGVVPAALGASMYLAFLISMQSPLGFALDQRTLLNVSVLPLPSLPTTVGMVTGLACLQGSAQLAVFLPACVVSSLPWHSNIALLAAALMLNVAIASVVNLICAATQLRPLGTTAPDIFQGVRAMLYILLIGLGMLPTAIVGSIGAVVFGAVLGFGWTTCAIGAAISAAALQPFVWWLTSIRWAAHEG